MTIRMLDDFLKYGTGSKDDPQTRRRIRAATRPALPPIPARPDESPAYAGERAFREWLGHVDGGRIGESMEKSTKQI